MHHILASQPNFRDLGGIPAPGGRKVRSGLLYRSGDLNVISDDDLAVMERLGIATIIDFRAEREKSRRPDRIPSTVVETAGIEIHDAARDEASRFFAEGDATGLEYVLIRDYVRMVDHHQEEFRRFFRLLETTPHLPLVFHCAAGKDRTGMAAVYLLFSLGVTMEVIRNDYLATNLYLREYTTRIMRKVHESGQNADILKPLFEVRKEYLDAALDRIDHHYGGLETYLREVIKVDFAAMKARYLE